MSNSVWPVGPALTLSKLDITRGLGPGTANHLIQCVCVCVCIKIYINEGLKGRAFFFLCVSHLKATPAAALAWDMFKALPVHVLEAREEKWAEGARG